MGRIVKESVITYLKVDYYAGEELSKDDGNPRGKVKENCSARANYLILSRI